MQQKSLFGPWARRAAMLILLALTLSLALPLGSMADDPYEPPWFDTQPPEDTTIFPPDTTHGGDDGGGDVLLDYLMTIVGVI